MTALAGAIAISLLSIILVLFAARFLLSWQLWLGILVGMALWTMAKGAEARDCQTHADVRAHQHYTYRIVEGKRCWYVGRRAVDKSLLHWASAHRAPIKKAAPGAVQQQRNEDDERAVLSETVWPPMTADNFNARFIGVWDWSEK